MTSCRWVSINDQPKRGGGARQLWSKPDEFCAESIHVAASDRACQVHRSCGGDYFRLRARSARRSRGLMGEVPVNTGLAFWLTCILADRDNGKRGPHWRGAGLWSHCTEATRWAVTRVTWESPTVVGSVLGFGALSMTDRHGQDSLTAFVEHFNRLSAREARSRSSLLRALEKRT